MFRRDFLRLVAMALSGALPAALATKLTTAAEATTEAWKAGHVVHLLPTVSDHEILIKASFSKHISQPPLLTIGDLRIAGIMSDTEGAMWQFRASGLDAGRRYRLALNEADQDGAAQLCDD